MTYLETLDRILHHIPDIGGSDKSVNLVSGACLEDTGSRIEQSMGVWSGVPNSPVCVLTTGP